MAPSCYVLTTDPEAYLMLEAREEKGGPAWHDAFAPFTVSPWPRHHGKARRSGA